MKKFVNHNFIISCFAQPLLLSENFIKHLASTQISGTGPENLLQNVAKLIWDNYNQKPKIGYYSKFYASVFNCVQLLNSPSLGQKILVADRQELLAFLQLLAGAVGSYNGEAYSVDEFKACVEANFKSFDRARALYTISACVGYKEIRPFAADMLAYLKKLNLQTRSEVAIDEILTTVVFLYGLWSQFEFLLVDEKVALLTNYFYLSIVVGAPVRQVLKDFLYEKSYVVMRYVTFNSFALDSLNENVELISASEPSKSESFLTVINNIRPALASVANFQKAKSTIDQFVNKYYVSQINSEFLKVALAEALGIYFAIDGGNLLDKYNFDENFLDEEFVKQLVLLEFCFYTNQWQRIVTYYKSGDLLVSPAQLMYQLLSDSDIKDDGDLVGKIFEFKELLLNSNILKAGDGDIVFDQSDAQFHWNEEVLK